jgi:hypothetical protein
MDKAFSAKSKIDATQFLARKISLSAMEKGTCGSLLTYPSLLNELHA